MAETLCHICAVITYATQPGFHFKGGLGGYFPPLESYVPPLEFALHTPTLHDAPPKILNRPLCHLFPLLSFPPPLSLPPTLTHSLPRFLLPSLPSSLTPSLPPSLPPSSLTSSLPHSLPPPFLPPSLQSTIFSVRLKPCPHYKPDSMRIHGSCLNPLPIHFNRVRTNILACEYDTA